MAIDLAGRDSVDPAGRVNRVADLPPRRQVPYPQRVIAAGGDRHGAAIELYESNAAYAMAPGVGGQGAADWEPLEFTVPDPLRDLGWRVEIDTEHPDAAGRKVDASAPVTLTGRSLMLLRGTQPAS